MYISRYERTIYLIGFMKYLLLLLAIAIVGTNAKLAWWEEVGAVNVSSGTMENPRFYVDVGKNSSVYIYWGFSTNRSVCFTKFSFDHKPLSGVKCYQGYYGSQYYLTGKGDDKVLYIVYSAPRKGSGYECSSSSTDGCYETYFVESADDGLTWSSPVKVPRKDMDDQYHRTLPKALYIPHTDRIVIFYVMSASAILPSTSVRFTARSTGSTVWSTEKTITSNGIYAFTELNAYYSKDGPNTYLHVFALQATFGFHYLRSTTNGVSWERKLLLSGENSYSCHPVHEPDLYSNILFAACSYNYYNMQFLSSEDFGATWRYKQFPKNDSSYIYTYSVAFSPEGKAKDKIALILLQRNYQDNEVILYNVATQEYRQNTEVPKFTSAVSTKWYLDGRGMSHVRVIWPKNYQNATYQIYHPAGSTTENIAY